MKKVFPSWPKGFRLPTGVPDDRLLEWRGHPYRQLDSTTHTSRFSMVFHWTPGHPVKEGREDVPFRAAPVSEKLCARFGM